MLAETIIIPLELLHHLKTTRVQRLLGISWLAERDSSRSCLRKLSMLARQWPQKMRKTWTPCEASAISVVLLSWQSAMGLLLMICHWAEGFPLDINLCMTLPKSIFDNRDDSLLLDKVDELMKKTWSILGINRPIHNLCLIWMFFQQYLSTMQLEPDLLFASHAMLTEVANEAKKQNKDALFIEVLSIVLASIWGWSEKRLGN